MVSGRSRGCFQNLECVWSVSRVSVGCLKDIRGLTGVKSISWAKTRQKQLKTAQNSRFRPF